MTQTIGTIRVKTHNTPSINSIGNSVRVSVNPGNSQRVQSINYVSNKFNFEIKNAGDVKFADELTDRGVITYDKDTEKFVVQDVPRLDGGTF